MRRRGGGTCTAALCAEDADPLAEALGDGYLVSDDQ